MLSRKHWEKGIFALFWDGTRLARRRTKANCHARVSMHPGDVFASYCLQSWADREEIGPHGITCKDRGRQAYMTTNVDLKNVFHVKH